MAPMQLQHELYADLLIKIGVNLQPGQGFIIGAELAHAPFVRLLTTAAYKAGAKFVRLNWIDDPSTYARLRHSQPDYLDYWPEYETAAARETLDEGWARIRLTGSEFPDAFANVDPAVIRRTQTVRAQKLKFVTEAVMADKVQWCVAAVPTPAWAKKIFPHLPADEAVNQLWALILKTVRADQPDPVAAWRAHDQRLSCITQFLHRNQVRALHFFDGALADDGQPSTDLTIGLTDAPRWVAASATTPSGVRFLPNMPTEEVFTTPHRLRVNGYVRTSKPSYPLEREMRDAYFKFVDGELVDFRARVGQDALQQFFELENAKYLGEVALVDVRSPINQSGVLFYDTLFDENAVCHIAFGSAYPTAVEGAEHMSEDERKAFGLNIAHGHEDLMIGTPTMQVTGIGVDGRKVEIMRAGQFVVTGAGS
jgi:aminopeptidase